MVSPADTAAWEQSLAEIARILSISESPSIPFPSAKATSSTAEASQPEVEAVPTTKRGKAKAKSKRKAADDEDDEDTEAKKAKTVEGEEQVNGASTTGDDFAKAAAAAMAKHFGLFEADSLRQPELPTKEQMAEALLEVRKKALREEYGV